MEKVPKLFRCEICDYYTSRQSQYNTHLLTQKHEILLNPTKSSAILPIFFCENCDYSTSRQSQYDRHLLTNKHKLLLIHINDPEFKKHECMCGKQYCHLSTLYTHKKTCKLKIEKKEDVETLVQYLMKENAEFKHLIIEQTKQMIELSKVPSNNITNNNNNNNFNLNLFLNETCKDALNIMDFVGQLQIGIKELEETSCIGFSEGITKIFMNGLTSLDVSSRPLHCSDFKRETLYIKNNDQWNKDSDDKLLLTTAIKHVVHKNMKQISEWTKFHPEYNDTTSKQNDKYLKIVCESMAGTTQEETNKNFNKIIKNIARETVIDKNI